MTECEFMVRFDALRMAMKHAKREVTAELGYLDEERYHARLAARGLTNELAELVNLPRLADMVVG